MSKGDEIAYNAGASSLGFKTMDLGVPSQHFAFVVRTGSDRGLYILTRVMLMPNE